MKDWWNGLSLKNKLQIPIQLLLLVILIVAQRWALDQFEKRVLSEAKQKAIVSSDGVINGLNIMMESGVISNKAMRRLFIKKMGASNKVMQLRVIRNKQVSDQFGPGMDIEKPVDAMDHAALDTAKPQFKLSTTGKDKTLRAVVPFIVSTNFRGTNCLMCHHVKVGSVNGAASITLNLDDEFAVMKHASILLWTAQILMQVILFFVIGWIINQVTRPTRELQRSMMAMQTDGDLSRRVPVQSTDEIGQTSKAFNALAESFQKIVGQVHGYAAQVSSSASALATNADKVQQSSQQQSEEAGTAAQLVDRMRDSIASVADNASGVYQLSQESLQRAHQGQQSMQEMMSEIAQVEDAVKQMAGSVEAFVKSTQTITSMTQQVRDIAEQTNLLALNAAIEAARAGEQGRGFAVVADEVRKLAEKSAQSASQIDVVTQTLSEQSEQVETRVQSGLESLQSSQDLMRTVAAVLAEASASVDNVNQGVDGITVSVNEQKQASQDIAQNVEHMAKMAEDNNAAIAETVHAVKDMETLAVDLRDAVGRFKV